ncbi:oxygen-independent coproporphyrinogen III oxidase [Carboxylicivirga linearis]|uniref:Coproporphyrinogen-III oxidase n=1 Tax=Carboxylicivirga linearis TaxID=1628157 RepID=A0ABS5JPF1_9BACT|nr:oxygen-independent coproporphyrinogen III oxidase [Carboxylicivirga linearis]MBS2096728.1 oxygen-independent coproporphyrinogen III oxidase [Carboxylicivirga linearis]
MLTFDRNLLDKYNVAGPRYTSYPPATFFHNEYGNEDYKESVIVSNQEKPENVSVYIHIPFCPQLCTFCGCTTYTGMGRNVIESYIDTLIKEIDLVSKDVSNDRKLTQVHWGGGTPNAISAKLIRKVTDAIKRNFTFAESYEMAMECSPAYLDYKMVDELKDMGFNRISLGVQDFKQEVLAAINRKEPRVPVKEMIAYLRKAGFSGINLDLVYGLPFQTRESFNETVAQALEANPDRLVTFSYAHVPSVMTRQKELEQYGLPGADEKIAMLEDAYNMAVDKGYVPIGMDHFAKPNDEFAVALKEKKLHRNFQGYCTRETTGQVYGFGTSSISQLFTAYSQNEKTIKEYMERVEKDGRAVVRGYKLNQNEQIVRQIINEVMCNYFVDFKQVATEFNVSVSEVYKAVDFQLEKIQSFINDDLLELNNDELTVKGQGRFVIRNIAMAFDPALKSGKGQYSKTV